MTRQKPLYPFERGPGRILLHRREEVLGHPELVDLGRDVVEGVERADSRAEREGPARLVVIVERLDAEVIAGEEEFMAFSVPNGDGEVPDYPLRHVLVDAPVDLQEEYRIVDVVGAPTPPPDQADQIVPVVDPRIRHQDDVPFRACDDGPTIEGGDGTLNAPKMSATEPDGSIDPSTVAFAPAKSDRARHSVQLERTHTRPIQAPEPEDRAHGATGCLLLEGAALPGRWSGLAS